MQATLDQNDIERVAKEVLKIISENYYLVPKQQTDEWVGIKEFVKALPIIKSPEWVRLYILDRPEFKEWAINIHSGKGHPTKVNKTKAMAWIQTHPDEIDWKQRLPH